MSQAPADLLRMARTAIQRHDYVTAMRAMQQLVIHDQETQQPELEMIHRSNLALMQNRLGFSDEALDNLEQALKLARQQHSPASESGIQGTIGGILREMGRFDEAQKALNAALIIARQIGDQRGEGNWLHHLALVYDDIDQHKQAQTYHAHAIAISRHLQDQRNLAYRLSNLGACLLKQGKTGEAITQYEEAIKIDRQLNDMSALLVHVNVLGNIYHSQYQTSGETEHLTLSTAYYREARHIARDQNDPISEARILVNMGMNYGYMKNYREALSCFYAARDQFNALNMPDQSASLQPYIEEAEKLSK